MLKSSILAQIDHKTTITLSRLKLLLRTTPEVFTSIFLLPKGRARLAWEPTNIAMFFLPRKILRLTSPDFSSHLLFCYLA